MRRPPVLGLLALALTGAGSDERRFGELHVRAIGPVTLRSTPRPHFEGPGPNITDVALLSPRIGIVSTWHYRGSLRRGSSGRPTAVAPGTTRSSDGAR